MHITRRWVKQSCQVRGVTFSSQGAYLAVAEGLAVRRQRGGLCGLHRPLLPYLWALAAVISVGQGMVIQAFGLKLARPSVS
jgi:hypothetical protein